MVWACIKGVRGDFALEFHVMTQCPSVRLICPRGGASGGVNQFPKAIKAGGRSCDPELFVSSLAGLGAGAVLHTLYYI